MNIDLITALLLGVAGCSAGFREIILSPVNDSFPKAPMAVRGALFIYAAALGGGAVLFGQAAPHPGDYAGAAAAPIAVFAVGLALKDAVLLVNLLRQRYDPAVWRRVNRISAIVKASCRSASVPARGWRLP